MRNQEAIVLRAVQNTDIHTRTWPHLYNAATGRTLELAPGEEAEVELPADFSDPFLVVVPPVPLAEVELPKPVLQEPKSLPSSKE